MEPTDMALQVAEHIMLLQSQIEGIKDWILNQPGAPTVKILHKQLFELESAIRNNQKFREQYDEFRSAIQAKDDAQDILQSLHNLVVQWKMTA